MYILFWNCPQYIHMVYAMVNFTKNIYQPLPVMADSFGPILRRAPILSEHLMFVRG
jgi:hypothetical protein